MNEKEILELLAESLEIDPQQLSLDREIADYPEWTSLAWLTIMSLADERLSVQLTAKDIRSFQTVGDVIRNLIAKAKKEK